MKTLKVAIFILLTIMLMTGSALAQNTFEAPVLITSAGQSIEAATVNFHFEKANIKTILENLAKPAKLEGNSCYRSRTQPERPRQRWHR